ncbi:MAG TPA: M56 family metallopeptidase [Gemmatimonadaceae bacterium]|nr:M56 family metallopeptidase [Gemmatimonadaceae bacterium]
MISWMLYTVIVGLCSVIAAWAADSLLRMNGRPSRFVWIGAALLACVLPASAPFRASLATRPSGEPVDPSALLLMQTSIQSVERHVPTSAPWFAIGVWVLATMLVAASFAVAYARLRRLRRAWPVVELHGQRVRLSPTLGPIVIGVVRSEIVIPRWVLSRAADEQQVILGHEAAHVGARDPLLLALACTLVALMPWNPALWIILSRVRLAIEVDCDARVLRRGVSPQSYGFLLVDVAERASPMRFAAPALADGPSHLHQRILAMQPRRLSHPVLRGATVALVGLAGLLVACEAKMPTAADVEQMDASSAERDARKLGMLPSDASVVWLVDGVITPEAAAKAIAPERIAKVDVGNVEGRSRMYILTKAAAKTGFAWTVDTVRVRHREGLLKDTLAVIRKLQTAAGGEAKPILVLDGVRSDISALAKLDRTRIDRVEVLKGEAAKAAYGAIGSNGVIVVTTKR